MALSNSEIAPRTWRTLGRGRIVDEGAGIVCRDQVDPPLAQFGVPRRLEGAPKNPGVYDGFSDDFCAETILWIAGGWSFPAYSRRRAGCAVTIEQRNRGLLPYRPMGTFFVVVPTPILHLFLGIRKA
jgi:hypothetical protein